MNFCRFGLNKSSLCLATQTPTPFPPPLRPPSPPPSTHLPSPPLHPPPPPPSTPRPKVPRSDWSGLDWTELDWTGPDHGPVPPLGGGGVRGAWTPWARAGRQAGADPGFLKRGGSILGLQAKKGGPRGGGPPGPPPPPPPPGSATARLGPYRVVMIKTGLPRDGILWNPSTALWAGGAI